MKYRPSLLRSVALSALIVSALSAAAHAAQPLTARDPATAALAGSSTLTLLAELALPGQPWDVAVTDDKAYVRDDSCSRGGGLQVVDLVDEARPVARGRACDLDQGGNLMEIVADAGMVALIPASSSIPFLVDARDPDNLKRGGSAEVTGGLNGSMVIDDQRLVLRQRNSGDRPDWVIAFDIADPNSPRETGRLSLTPSKSADYSNGLAAYQGVYYVVEGDLRIIEINAEGVPRQVGSAPIPRRESVRLDQLVVDTVAHRLYAVDELHLWVYDIARPSAPRLLAEAISPPLPEFDNRSLPFKMGEFEVRNNLALAKITVWPSSEGSLIVAFDVTDPATPIQIDVQSPFAYVGMDLDARGNLVAVGSRDANPGVGGRLDVFGITGLPKQTWQAWVPVLFNVFSNPAPVAPTHRSP